MRRDRAFFLIIAALVSGGCATRYAVVTNAYLDRSINATQLSEGSSFAALPNEGVPNPIFDEEVRSKIEGLIRQKGYTTASAEKADYPVRFSYDIVGKTITTARPVRAAGPPVVQQFYVSGSNQYHTHVFTGLDYVTYVPETYTAYASRLFVKVAESGKEEKVVWVGDTINESQDPDLRRMIDYLLVATFEYFGQNTGMNRVVSLAPDDPGVLQLRASEREIKKN